MSETETNNNVRYQGEPTPTVLGCLTAPFRFVGSLTVALSILAVLLVVLAWGTFIESEYGAGVARFVLYGNLWFVCLVALLALNITCSIIGHFAWSRYKIPFLTSHVGILILIFGCFLTFRYGEEAQITLPEGTIGSVAVKPEKQQFEFRYITHSAAEMPKAFHIPFQSGPFSWQEYQYDNWVKNERQYKTILWYAMQLGNRDIGEMSSGDPNISIEVLDYYAHSTLEQVPPFDLSILWKKSIQTVSELGEVKEIPRNWEPLRLEFRQSTAAFHDIRGASGTMSQGERVSFSLAGSQEELIAFQKSRPKNENSEGFWGEIVLYYGGQHYSVSVEQLINLTENQRLTVDGSSLQLGNVRFRDRGPLISFSLFTPSGESETMTLMPDNPELNVQAKRLGVFGSYWVNPVQAMQQSADLAAHPMLKRLALPRLDFMQGPDQKLYYRFWSGQKIIADGIVPDREGQNKPQFKLAAQTPEEVEIVVDRFVPQDIAGFRIVPAFAVGRQQNEQRVKLHITFDGKEDTFWLRAVTPTVVPLLPEPDQIRYIYGNERTLCVQLNFENIDLGFGILLKRFEKRTEPGTRMAAHFSSLVDFVEPLESASVGTSFSRELNQFRVLPEGKDVLISMNRPGFFRGTGQGYRIYQSSYLGPFYPDQPQFHELYDGTIFPWETRPREEIAMSTLSVNDDPGRGWKYFGCFLIVLGTALFVWRKH